MAKKILTSSGLLYMIEQFYNKINNNFVRKSELILMQNYFMKIEELEKRIEELEGK